VKSIYTALDQLLYFAIM